MKVMWNLIRLYKNSRFLTAWKYISPKKWIWGPERFNSPEDVRPCMICRRQMECACNDWSTNQPWGGGQVTLAFHYGSCKFDHCMLGTFYTGFICDDCGELCMKRGEMEMTNAN